MRISEQAFRRILREEARRTRLFEATDAPAEQGQSVGAAAPAPAAAAAAPAPAPAAASAGSTALDQLKADLRNIMFGSNGAGGPSSLANNKTAMLWTDMVLDAFAGVGESESDDGDLARLPAEVKEQILDQTVEKARAKKLDKDTFYEIVRDNYSNTFPDLDPPQQDDAMTRPGTNTYWPYVQAVVLKYQKAAAAEPATNSEAGAAGAGAAGTGSTYTVARGDTLSHVALRFYKNGTPAAYQALAAVNNIKAPYGLAVNQKLTLPSTLNVGGTNLPLNPAAPAIGTSTAGSSGTLSENRRRVSIVWGR